MTTYNKATLKTFFETGDVPGGTDYANFIDSYVNIVDTTEQSMAGSLNTTELITPRVSAAIVNVTGNFTVSGNVSSNNIYSNNIYNSSNILTTTLSATLVNSNSIVASAATFATSVSADTVYTSAVRTQSGVYQGVGIVSAAGSAQSTAALLTNIINRGKGVVDGQATGFAIPSNRTGLTQYLYNEGASANLWPPSGGTINGLAANAAFSLAASAMVTIIHLTASAMAVK